MMTLKNFAKLLAAATLLSSAVAQASPITFIYTGTGTGTIGSTAFTDAAFTITEQSDTSDLQSCGSQCSYINALSTTVSIDNIGQFDFTVGTRTFLYTTVVGLSRAGRFGADLYDVFSAPGYDLQSSIGPVGGNATLLQWNIDAVTTTGGTLSFADGGGNGTFQAIVGTADVPEPASLALLGLGVAGLAAARRRKAA